VGVPHTHRDAKEDGYDDGAVHVSCCRLRRLSPWVRQALEAFSDQIRTWRVWRGQDDPNLVVIEETFDSRRAAETLWTSPQTEAAMEADGIDMASVRIRTSESPIAPSLFPLTGSPPQGHSQARRRDWARD
jgi:hypothetical protein